MKPLLNQLLFRLGAWGYDDLTSQHHWRRQIGDMVSFLEPADAQRPLDVLDLGCGPGVSAFELAHLLPAGTRVTGVDLSPEMIVRARRHYRVRHAELTNVDFVEADAAALPFDDARFDLITGHSFLYLVMDRGGVLREARRVLKPDGLLVFMEPARNGGLLDALRHAPQPLAAMRTAPLDTTRFAASMFFWRVASAIAGRLDHELLEPLFTEAGFDALACHPTLGGLGLHVVAR